jgi:L-amino acid N-acyltransferase YncA
MASISTRQAREADCGAIARIYNQGIAERVATFETESRTPAQIAAQLREKGERYPTLIAEDAGRIMGFATAGPYRSRACYSGIAEHSVYVDASARGMGIGRALLAGLISRYEALGFWKLLSRIFPENGASLRLHQRAGFRTVGIYRRHAQLDGAWRDVVIVERLLGPAQNGEAAPDPRPED